MKVREPFSPPYTKQDIPVLDMLHDYVGLGECWAESEARQKTLDTPDPEGSVFVDSLHR